MIALIAAAGAGLALLLALARLSMGPTLYDRALAANSIALRAGLVCAALAAAFGRTLWLDAAFALILGALVVSAAVLKFFRARSFQPPMAREEA